MNKFKDGLTRRIFGGEVVKGLSPDLVRRAIIKLTMVEAATEIRELAAPPSNRLEKLKGDRLNQWSIRVNDKYRICFKWEKSRACEIDFYRLSLTKGRRNMNKKILISVGDIIKEEYLDPMGISAYRLAREIGVSTSLMSQIIRGKTAISADTAWRLGQFFDTSAQYWLNMQASCNSRMIEEKYANKNLKISSYQQFAKALSN